MTAFNQQPHSILKSIAPIPKGAPWALNALFQFSLGLLCLLWSPPVWSEFVKTSPSVLQSTDRRLKVITSHQSPGVFMVFGDPIDLQLFDPAQLEAPTLDKPSAHFFVEYDPSFDRYTVLRVGGREFRIRGGFTLVQEVAEKRLRLTVDNNNPYLSLVYEPLNAPDSRNKEEPMILGFRGLDLVVNKVGQKNVALLEANQFNQYKGLIEPYALGNNGISLKGEPFSGSAIGVELEPTKNLCLKAGTTVLSQTELDEITELKDRTAAVKRLEELLASRPAVDAFRGVLLLRIDSAEIIGLDYAKGMVKIVRPLPNTSRPICVVSEEISLDG